MAPDTADMEIAAGRYPAELVEACRRLGTAPGALLSWAVRPDGVTVILPDGAKARVGIRGGWAAKATDQDASAVPAPAGKKSKKPA